MSYHYPNGTVLKKKKSQMLFDSEEVSGFDALSFIPQSFCPRKEVPSRGTDCS